MNRPQQPAMAGIDLSRFHQTFFDESAEGLDLMEAALLRLDPAIPDGEAINAIFRAAHSIKGGAATFGFSELAGFTHLLETLLDGVRSGAQALHGNDIDLLLRAVDALRGLLAAARGDGKADTSTVNALLAALQQRLQAAPTPGSGSTTSSRAPAAPQRGWRIAFQPSRELFASGNDPLRILRELSRLGDCEIGCDVQALPTLAQAQAEHCYLAWRIDLIGDCERTAIAEVFSWVEGECELSIEPLSQEPVNAARVPLAVIDGGRASEPAASNDHRSDGGSIRIGTGKIDSLINLVGELVITQAMLQQLADALDPVLNEKLLHGLSQLDRNTRELQEAVMSVRMLPVDFVFSRFPRMVRDLAAKLGKQVRLVLSGEHTELDKGVIERIADPLTHLVRNALDHGLETVEQRHASGKDATGTLRLSAAHQGGHIVIAVSDDGRGLDRAKLIAKAQERGIAASEQLSDGEAWQLIFAPGFSTATEVTDVSGRGVGMDVVKKNIEGLGGAVEISSQPGHGMSITIRLPLTLAILDGMSVRVGEEVMIVPLNCVVESLQPQPEQIRSLSQQAQVVKVRSEFVPLLPLHQLFSIAAAETRPEAGILVLLEAGGRKVAVLVDELVGQQQVVVKSLEHNYRRVPGISGATILGDGRVALILDAPEIIRLSTQAQAA